MQGRMQTGWRVCCDENAGTAGKDMAARWICGQITGNLQADVRTRKPAKPHKTGRLRAPDGILTNFLQQ